MGSCLYATRPVRTIATMSKDVAIGRRMNVRDGLIYLPLCVPLCAPLEVGVVPGRGDAGTGAPAAGGALPGRPVAGPVSLVRCGTTWVPSCSLSTPVITTMSPGASPDVTSLLSPSVVPMVIGRTVTLLFGCTRKT